MTEGVITDETKDAVTASKEETTPTTAETAPLDSKNEDEKKEEVVTDPSESYLGRPLTGVERSFGKLFANKCLGLLASVLPKELTVSHVIIM